MDGQMCKYFKNNCCLKGEDCLFSHALSTFPCKFFHTRGHCLDMESCRFSHEVQLLRKFMIFQVVALESSLLWDSFVIFLSSLISHYFPKCPLTCLQLCMYILSNYKINASPYILFQQLYVQFIPLNPLGGLTGLFGQIMSIQDSLLSKENVRGVVVGSFFPI